MAMLQQIPATLDLFIEEGDTVPFTVKFNGIDVTGFTFDALIAGVQMIVEVIDAPHGEIKITIPSSTAIKNNSLWRLKWTVNGVRRTVVKGKVFLQ
jgi:hypothetical protein